MQDSSSRGAPAAGPSMDAALGTRPLAGRVAIVTGASRGIGRRIAFALGQAGAILVTVARPVPAGDESELDRAAIGLLSDGIEVVPVHADASTADGVELIATAALQRYGRIDILINNAAIRLSSTILDTTMEEMRRIVDVNVLGPFLLWKRILPVMIERGGGNIVSVVSTNAAQQPFIGMAPYRMTKAALTFLTVDLAMEVANYGIAVNGLDPGPIRSPGTSAIRAEREQRYGLRFPYHSLDSDTVIDEPIVWLASRDARSFSGHVVRRVEFGISWGPGPGR